MSHVHVSISRYIVHVLFIVLISGVWSTLQAGVVINEIHYEPEDITQPREFLELFNPDGVEVDLSGWAFASGIQYTFEPDTKLAPGAYLVIAQDPQAVQDTWGVVALGPYLGKLSNQGESVELADDAGEVQDEVEYVVAFPWPLSAAGDGSSMSLIHPQLDNNLGASWRSGVPTPGAQNSVYAENAPPQMRQVNHSPQQPAPGESAIVTVKVTDPDGVKEVLLRYQVVEPGNHIPAHLAWPRNDLLTHPTEPRELNPDFEDPANWQTVNLLDDGQGADQAAGDDVYTVTLPSRANRTLVRYRIVASDNQDPSASVQAPFADDKSLNFAYFVYGQIPPYEPTDRTVHPDGLGHFYSAEIMRSLPVYTLLTREVDMTECVAYVSIFEIPRTFEVARETFNWDGTFIYDGIVYDHIQYRLRGRNQRYQLSIKRNMRFRFNRGNFLRARDQTGELYPTRWRMLNTAKMFGPRNVGNFGVTETINNFILNLIDVPSPFIHTFHFRVIDGTDEAPTGAGGQYAGDFWGMALAIEDYDARFLRARDLPKGNLYKLKDGELNGKEQQRYQAADAVEMAEDYVNISSNSMGLRPGRDEAWLREFVDYETWNRYHAVAQAIRHYDIGVYPERSNPDTTPALKNAAWYFLPSENDPLDAQLWMSPYDTEQSWGPNGAHQGWDLALYAMTDPANDQDYLGGPRRKPELQKGFRNYLREFRDLVWNEETLNPMIDHFAAVVTEFANADRDRWKDHPDDGGEQSDFGTLEDRVQDMKNFAFVGGQWPINNEDSMVGPGGRAAFLDDWADLDGDATSIPNTPVVTSTSPAGHPVGELTFETSAFSDPQGANTFAAMKWRVGEITDPTAPAYDPNAPPVYEVTEVWESDVITAFEAAIQVPPEVVQAGHSYRIRVRMMDDTNRWGHWSDPVGFIPTSDTGLVSGDVIITEILANVDGPDDNKEWFEVFNTTDGPIDLDGLAIVDNDTDLHVITGSLILPAKSHLVLGASTSTVSNGGIPVDYAYGTDIALGNDNDEIILVDGGTVIHSVGYGESFAKLPRQIVSIPGSSPARGFAIGMAADYCEGPVGNWQLQTTAAGEATGTPGADNDGVAVCSNDTEPPQLLSGEFRRQNRIVLQFDESLDPTSAGNVANYNVDGAIGSPESVLLEAADTVRLVFSSSLDLYTQYSVSVDNIADANLNPMTGVQRVSVSYDCLLADDCYPQALGDSNGDGQLDISDVVRLLLILFGGESGLPCGDGSIDDPGNLLLIDWQPDDGIDLSDAVSVLNALFDGGPPHHLSMGDEGACVRIAGCPDASACQ